MTRSSPHVHLSAPGPKALAVYCERRSLVMLALGFAAGLPFWLIFDTLSAWLRQAGLSLDVIAFFTLATLAYAFKFLWAPLVDRTQNPRSHRAGWDTGARGCWWCKSSSPSASPLISLSDPLHPALGLMATFAVLTGFAAATQDIVIDAWRIEVAPQRRAGRHARRLSMGLSHRHHHGWQAVPLLLAEAFSWSVSYGTMAMLMIIGMAAVLLAPREQAHTVAFHLAHRRLQAASYRRPH